jgi:hypothetical protein
MDNPPSLYRTEQEGVLRVDKLLVTFCVAIVPGFLALFASINHLSPEARPWAIGAIALNIPALFTLLWHSFRCPVRLQHLHEAVLEACEALSGDIKDIFETIAIPQSKEAIFGKQGEKIIKGPDGKEYVEGPREKIREKMTQVFLKYLDTNNPLVANTIAAHSEKIYKAQRNALTGRLTERHAGLKQILDVLSRYTRHLFFSGVLICSTICVLKLIQQAP